MPKTTTETTTETCAICDSPAEFEVTICTGTQRVGEPGDTELVESRKQMNVCAAHARQGSALRAKHRLASSITDRSREVFIGYARDAANWSGTPLVGGNTGGSTNDRGNLTQLKRAGLITTFKEHGETWIVFTEKGAALAHEHGISISGEPIPDAIDSPAIATQDQPGQGDDTMPKTDIVDNDTQPETFTPRHTRAGWANYRVSGGTRERVTAYFATADALATAWTQGTWLGYAATPDEAPDIVVDREAEAAAIAEAVESIKLTESGEHKVAALKAAQKKTAAKKTAAKKSAKKSAPIPEGTAPVGHKFTWYVWVDGERVKRTSAHKGTMEGFGVECSCGWTNSLPGDSYTHVRREVVAHKDEIGVELKITPKFKSAYDGKLYIDEIAAKQAEYEAETGERPTRATASVILDRERDAAVEGADTPTIAIVETESESASA